MKTVLWIDPTINALADALGVSKEAKSWSLIVNTGEPIIITEERIVQERREVDVTSRCSEYTRATVDASVTEIVKKQYVLMEKEE